MDMLSLTLALLLEWLWVAVAVAAALAFAAGNFIDEWLLELLKKITGKTDREASETKEANDDEAPEPIGTLVIISGLFGLVVMMCFGAYAHLSDTITISINQTSRLVAIGVGIIEIAWLPAYLTAMNRAGAINVAPLFQVIPVIAFGFGYVFYGEVPGLVPFAGAMVIVCGGFLLNTTLAERRVDLKTIGLMLMASTIITAAYFFFRDSALEGNFVATAFWSGLGMLIGAGIAYCYKPYRKEFTTYVRRNLNTTHIVTQFGNEVMDNGAVLLSQKAILLGPSVALVTSLNAFQPLFILLIGWVRAKGGSVKHQEALAGREGAKRVFAIILIAIGTVLVVQS